MDVTERNAQQASSARNAARIARHTERVRHLRLVAPALAAGLIVTYALSATPPRIDRQFAEQFSAVETSEDGVRLARPRYSGEDLSGRPFEVAAASATRPGSEDQRVGLENPEAQTIGADGRSTRVTARTGLYDQAARRIDLTDDVELTQGEGADTLRLLTNAAEVDLDRQVVSSSTEVRGAGETGTVRADRATLYQNEDRVVLEGGVEITLEPKAPEAQSVEDDPEG